MPARMAWYKNAACMASRTTSLPRNENEILLTPPETFAQRQCLFDLPRGLDEIERVAVVLLDAGADGENVRVENDVAAGEADFFGEQLVGAAADGDFVIDFGGLAGFVEGHHHDGGAVTAGQAGVVQERFFAFLQADRIDDRFALHAFQAGFDDRPFRAVDHDRHAGNFGLGGQQIQEFGHDRFAVEQRFVQVHVEDVGAAFDLAAGDADGFFEFAFFDEAGEFFAAGDVGALADHDEIRFGPDRQRFQTAEAREGLDVRTLAWRRLCSRPRRWL